MAAFPHFVPTPASRYDARMLRLLIFFVAAIFLSQILGHLPLIGGLFARTGILGLWITALLLAWGVSKWGERAVRVSASRNELRRLLAVDTPHNHGKAGSLLYAQGRRRAALSHLEAAAAGEPEVADWHYRLGRCRADLGELDEGITSLQRAVELDPEHAYGAAQLRLAEALSRRGDEEEALAALATFDRNHGSSPESCYRRGKALSALGRSEEARAAYDEVGRLADDATRYQAREARMWAFKARLAAIRA